MELSNEECFTLGPVAVTRETPQAIMVSFRDENHWIPKSQIHGSSEARKPKDTGLLVVTQSYAKKKDGYLHEPSRSNQSRSR